MFGLLRLKIVGFSRHLPQNSLPLRRIRTFQTGSKEEEKRCELFFNEVLAQDAIDCLFDPKVLTNWKRYSVDGEQKATAIKREEKTQYTRTSLSRGTI